MKKLLSQAVAFALVAAFGSGGVAFANNHEGKAHGKKHEKHGKAHDAKAEDAKHDGAKAEEHKEAH